MDAVLGFLNNTLILTPLSLLWGFWVKYHPSAKKVSNQIIPWVTAIATFIVKVFAPPEAEAAVLNLGPMTIVPFGTVGAIGGVLGAAIGGIWQGGLSAIIYDKYLASVVERLLRWKRNSPKETG